MQSTLRKPSTPVRYHACQIWSL